MPDAPVAAPPAASSPAPAAPATVAAPAASAPAVVPTSPAPAATPVAPKGPQPPDTAKFSDPSEAILADMQYQRELTAWKAENPDAKPEEATVVAETVPEAKTAVEEPKPDTQAKVEEPEESFTLDEDPPLTPQAFNELIKGKPERQAYFDSDPELKNAVMKMSREHAELSQFKGIYATAESAKFAKETAARTVSLRTQFQNAETPEHMATAFDSFMQEFAVVGPDGKQLKDEAGEPVYSDDLYLMTEHIVNDRYIGNELAEVEARIKANQYKTDQERVNDLDRKTALEILRGDFVTQEKPKPDFSGLPEDKRAEMQRWADELEEKQRKIDEAEGKKGKQSREAQRKQAHDAFWSEYSPRVVNAVNGTIEKLRKAGALIPDWMLQTTYPGTKTPIFYDKIGKAVDDIIQSDPFLRKTALEMESMPPTPENIQQRIKWADGLLQQTNGKGVSNIRAIIADIVRSFGKSVTDQAKNAPEPKTTASPEPKGGGVAKPAVMTADDAYYEAERQNAKEIQGWAAMTDAERMAHNMAKQRQLLSAKR
jgi:hypothetical protein